MTVHVSVEVFASLCVMLLSSILTTILHKKFKVLLGYRQVPITIIIGALAGLFLKKIVGYNAIEFSSEGFFNLILPPICFQAGYNIRGHRVLSNLHYILLYGIIGTLVSMTLFIVGLSTLNNFFQHDSSLKLNAYYILLLASLLSNWETHTCILILEEKEYPTLTSLMFGETMVNDAVIIALFNTINDLYEDASIKAMNDVTLKVYGEMLLELLNVGFISVLLGVAIALLMCFLMRQMRRLLSDNPYLQMLLVLVAGYMSFMVSEMLHYAGALTIFCAGFVLSYYAFQSMSEKGQTLTKVTAHFLGFLPESFIFAYIGLNVPMYFIESWNELIWLAAIIVGSFYVRAISVYALYFIGALFRGKVDKYSFKSTTMLVLAGTIRGAIPFALAMTVVGHGDHNSEQDEKALLIAKSLLLTIFFTTPTLGGLVKCWLTCLGLEGEGGGHRMTYIRQGEQYQSLIYGSMAGHEVRMTKMYRNMGWCGRTWAYVNDRFMKPLFGKKEKLEQKITHESVRMTVLRSIDSSYIPPSKNQNNKESGVSSEGAPKESVQIINNSAKE